MTNQIVPEGHCLCGGQVDLDNDPSESIDWATYWHKVCVQRRDQGRCLRCGQYEQICGHSMSFSDRIKHVRMDTAWMPNAGSEYGRLRD